MFKFKRMKSFNLNHYILVQITDYGWAELEKYEQKSGNIGFAQHCVRAKKEIVNGKEYYRLQAHFVMQTFGHCLYCYNISPINSNVLVPKHREWRYVSLRERIIKAAIIYVVSVVAICYLISKFTGL